MGIGILQGRLSPDPEGRFQFFPEDWKGELNTAASLGFSGIEWLVDPNDRNGWENNPAFSDVSGIDRVSKKSGTTILSICADWFMTVSPFDGEASVHANSLRRLIPAAEKTRNKLILVPLLEKHSIVDRVRQHRAVEVFSMLRKDLEQSGVSIGFETELPLLELIDFVDRFKSSAFGVYYDVGNCTSYGFNCSSDIRILGARVKGVHIKDRKVGTTQSVMLGDGDADLKGVVAALHDINWKGDLVMQAWRGKEYLDDAQRQLLYLKSIVKEG